MNATATLPIAVLLTAMACHVRPPSAASKASGIDTASLRIADLDVGNVRAGENMFHATVVNRSDEPVALGLDLRAVPGMWLRPNWQHAYAFRIAPHSETRIEAPYTFVRLSTEARLRVTFGVEFEHPLLQRWFNVGEGNPAATDPRRSMTELHTSRLDLYATIGSTAASELPAIAASREAAIDSISAMLGVSFSDRIRLVFYPDSATKTRETGHIGMGWASNGTIVEIRNAKQRLNPYHEIAHIVAAKLGDPPAFLNEGFATYVSERLGSRALDYLSTYGGTVDSAACEIVRKGLAIPLDTLVRFDEIGSGDSRPSIAYPESASLTKYLIATRGLGRFRQAYSGMSNSEDAVKRQENIALFVRLFGGSLEAIERDWRVGLHCNKSVD